MVKRIALVLGSLMLAPHMSLAQTSTWVPDKAHSGVNFSILHLSVARVRGHFGNITGTITMNDADITKSSVNVVIDVSTVDTGVEMRDKDLKSPNYFDVAQFPMATFTSTSVTKSPGGLTVNGDLTLHGVTKPVVLQVEGPSGPIPAGNEKKLHSGFEATTTISRTAFGIAPKALPAALGDEVKLTIDLDMIKQ
jgi:polyisoprenoid-binding protein YceI